jgi:hypothetical protein
VPVVLPDSEEAGALEFVGIEGTSTNKADVASAGQLLTTSADPNAEYNYRGVFGRQRFSTIAAPSGGDAFTVASIHMNTFSNSKPADDPIS